MRNRLIITFFIAVLLVFVSGCDNESARMDDFKVDFATVLRSSASLTNHTPFHLQLDNGQILTPVNRHDYAGGHGQRVIINYTPLGENEIRIRAISDIFTGNIRTEGFSEQLVQEPVRIQSVWVGGEHLNMILEVQRHSVPHSVALFRDPDSPSIDLHFSYSRNNDPSGSLRMLHLSFRLGTLREEADAPIPFRLFINTHSGMREFDMVLR
jgi:hypothetical protein